MKRLANLVSHRLTPAVVFILSAVVLSTGLVALALLTKPIADDYSYFSHPLIHNPILFTADFFVNQTGRYAQGALVSILYRLFGDASTVIGPILLLASLIGSSTWLSYLLLAKKSYGFLWSLAVGSFTSCILILAAPSIFDAFLWLTSSTVYIASLIASILVVGFAIWLYKQQPKKWWYVAFFVFTFIAQSFSEPTSAILIAASITIAGGYLFYKNKRVLHISLLTFVASTLGFLTVYLSAGSRNRQHASGSEFNLYEMFVAPLHDFAYVWHYLTSWRFFLILSLAVLAAQLLPKLSNKQAIRIAGLSVISSILPLYILFVITHYSMGSYIPLRSYTVPIALLVVGIAIALAVGISQLQFVLRKNNHRQLYFATVGILACIIAIVVAAPPMVSIGRAEALRGSLHDTREAAIYQQLAERKQPLEILPAPLIIQDSEAIDFRYNSSDQISWFTDGFRRYYGIPQDTELRFTTNPPAGYCLKGHSTPWYGVSGCYNKE